MSHYRWFAWTVAALAGSDVSLKRLTETQEHFRRELDETTAFGDWWRPSRRSPRQGREPAGRTSAIACEQCRTWRAKCSPSGEAC